MALTGRDQRSRGRVTTTLTQTADLLIGEPPRDSASTQPVVVGDVTRAPSTGRPTARRPPGAVVVRLAGAAVARSTPVAHPTTEAPRVQHGSGDGRR